MPRRGSSSSFLNRSNSNRSALLARATSGNKPKGGAKGRSGGKRHHDPHRSKGGAKGKKRRGVNPESIYQRLEGPAFGGARRAAQRGRAANARLNAS